MADMFSGAPQGITSAVEIINTLPKEVQTELCHEVMQFLQYKTGLVDTIQLHHKCEAASCSIGLDSLQTAVNALCYVYRAAARGRMNADQLTGQLKKSALFSEASLMAIGKTWAEQGHVLCSSDLAEQVINIGQLVDIQWKLGIAMSSSQCRNLNAPFVTMVIKVAEPSGHITTKSIEMSIQEFQNFSRQLKNMSSVLETV